MELTKHQRELIGRGTMLAVAVFAFIPMHLMQQIVPTAPTLYENPDSPLRRRRRLL
jgi:hypothetical protein